VSPRHTVTSEKIGASPKGGGGLSGKPRLLKKIQGRKTLAKKESIMKGHEVGMQGNIQWNENL